MATHLPILPSSSLAADGTRNFVYPADVRGRFTRARMAVFAVLVAVYVAIPWVTIGGHPALYFDIAERRFFVFGATLNAQDSWMMVFVLTGAAFGLVFVTALLGRAWCGWACPQTVFLEGIYRRIERMIEGPRAVRMKRNNAAWTFDKAWRKVVVHAAWIAVSIALAHVFLSYFVSLRQLFAMVRERPSAHPEAFVMTSAVSALIYFDFAWFREQLCVVLCPYGRLQSVLLDPDSLVVGYDARRGEPRGKVKDPNRGDCVACNRCVVVCPTGIDIRNGLQMDCVACSACIDACDEVMDKLGQKRGLIRYDSQNGLAGLGRRVLRVRVYIYAALGALGVAAATLTFGTRAPFEANVLRVQGAPYVIEDGVVRNMYHVHIVNKCARATTFHLEPEAAANVTFTVPLRDIPLSSLASADAPLFATMPRAAFGRPTELRLRVRSDNGDTREIVASFLGPVSGATP